MTKDLMNILGTITTKNLQECYHDAIYYRDEIRILFKNGVFHPASALLRKMRSGTSWFP